MEKNLSSENPQEENDLLVVPTILSAQIVILSHKGAWLHLRESTAENAVRLLLYLHTKEKNIKDVQI